MKKIIFICMIFILCGCQSNKEMIEISLPEIYKSNGFNVVAINEDRIIIANKQRASIIDLDTLIEEIIVEAEFGVNVAANDEYIVYGIGGDEFWEVKSYHIDTKTVETILEDEVGILNLEIDRKNQVYYSMVSKDAGSYYVSSWNKYNLETKRAETIPTFERSMAAYLLKNEGLSLDIKWNYEIGKTRNVVYTNGVDFAYNEITLLNNGSYQNKLYHYNDNKSVLIDIVESVEPLHLHFYHKTISFQDQYYDLNKKTLQKNEKENIYILKGKIDYSVTLNQYQQCTSLYMEK